MEETKKLIPKRRFKEFQNAGDWEQRKLNELARISTGYPFDSKDFSGNGNYLVITNGNIQTDSDTVIESVGNRINIDINDVRNEYILKQNDILVTMDGTVGRTAKVVGDKLILAQRVGRLVANSDSDFLYQFLNTGKFFDVMKLVSHGGTIKHISLREIENYENHFPLDVNEERKIGRFLTGIDNLITLQQHKLEKIKAMKKAYLYEMFPAEGESKPKRRFKGFTDDWELHEFGKVFSHLQNNSFSRAHLSYECGEIMNVHYGDILVEYGECLDVSNNLIPRIINSDFEDKYRTSYIEDGDIIIADAAEDETVGKCCEIRGLRGKKMLSGLHTIPCRPVEKFATGYLGYYMNSGAYHDQLLPLIQGTKVSSISKSALKYTYICYPKNIKEQEKIGTYFIELDNFITLHQSKLDKLKNLKKAYLNEMFI